MNGFRTTILLAVLTALVVWIGQMVGGPNGAVMALLFAGAMNFFSYWFSDKIVLKMYGGQQITANDDPELYGLVQELAAKGGLPQSPARRGNNSRMGATFLFYDFETTGLSRAYDQILEFAAIRTDAVLNEIERFSASLRLREDVIPSPAAILVNRIRTARFSSGRREYEAVLDIHREMNRPGTTGIGYNSIGFDDEFLRFSLHRNLLPPYTHQFSGRCRRMDLLPITIIYWLYRMDALDWPELNGKASLKLEDIGAANGLLRAWSPGDNATPG